jgi:hypothetical protein
MSEAIVTHVGKTPKVVLDARDNFIAEVRKLMEAYAQEHTEELEVNLGASVTSIALEGLVKQETDMVTLAGFVHGIALGTGQTLAMISDEEHLQGLCDLFHEVMLDAASLVAEMRREGKLKSNLN